MAMFNLTEDEIRQSKLLDCPAGACSFTAYAHRIGGDATAADIAYAFGAEELRAKGLQDLTHAMQQVAAARDSFVWRYFDSVASLEASRRRALEENTADRQLHPSRYVQAVLPELPFEDRTFDMTLSAHLLFTYSERLDLDFHRATLLELMRVTRREIRVFPIVDHQGEQSVHLGAILELIEEQQWQSEVVASAYEFQRGADRYLRIYRP